MLRFAENAGFLLSNLGSNSTGVDGAVVWVACGDFSADEGHLGPRILVVPGAGLSMESLAHAVAVTLSTPAVVVGALPAAVSRKSAELRGNEPGCASRVLARGERHEVCA